jgi:hypothetical protein
MTLTFEYYDLIISEVSYFGILIGPSSRSHVEDPMLGLKKWINP